MDPKELRGLMEAYQQVNAPQEEIDEASYSAKAARAGKDIGKPGKAFSKIAASAAKRYGSEERGKKVAGAVLAKLRKEEIEILEDVIDENRMASRMEKMPSAPAKVGKATHSIKDLAPSKEPTPEEKAKARKALGLGEGKSSRPRYPGGRGVLDQERRDKKREASAENMRGHTEGPGNVTKNPKKLRKQKAMGELGEKVDLFDTVLEFLQAEGYAETLEEAEWLMANVIDEEAIAIVIGEAQVANRDPDKYEREQSKKSAPVRGEKTPMPPRGDKRREDFEKWYAANVR